MKGATLLSKSKDAFREISLYLQSLNYPNSGGDQHSIVLDPQGEFPFYFYNRSEGSLFLERFEIPAAAVKAGYLYGYSVECRSESIFCAVLRGLPADVLICDSNEKLFMPSELDAESLSL